MGVRTKSALEIKMDKFGKQISSKADSRVAKSGLEAGDKPVLEMGARFVHDVETLAMEKEEGKRELRDKVSRFGVGENAGLAGRKLEKKMKMLENRREDMGEDARRIRGALGVEMSEVMGEVDGMDLDSEEGREKAKVVAKERLVEGKKRGGGRGGEEAE